MILFLSCDNRKIKHVGLNEFIEGFQIVRIYENGDFFIDLGEGGQEGVCEIKNDTVYIKYNNEKHQWPKKLYMSKTYFETVADKNNPKSIKISRLI